MPKSDSNLDSHDEQSSLQGPVEAQPNRANQESPLVYVLVLHWRGVENTRNCLSSLHALNYPHYKTLLVDNGSDNEDGKVLQAEFAEVELLRLDDNYGFSGGCNKGIDYCTERGADLIWLLNNDATVEADTLSLLVKAMQAQPRSGAASAAVLETSSALPTISTTPTIPGRGVLDFAQAKALLKPVPDDKPVACDWLAGSNLLLRVAALNQTGAFDSRYFLYFEDTELCHKLRHAGWSCLFVPAARISHIGNASTGDSLQHWRAYYYTRNRLLFFATYTKFPMSLLTFASIYWHLIRHCFSLPFRGAARVRQLRAELFGLRDFFAGSFGKCAYIDKI